jgi:hypothetical protein
MAGCPGALVSTVPRLGPKSWKKKPDEGVIQATVARHSGTPLVPSLRVRILDWIAGTKRVTNAAPADFTRERQPSGILVAEATGRNPDIP